jgi:hypothetical protein
VKKLKELKDAVKKLELFGIEGVLCGSDGDCVYCKEYVEEHKEGCVARALELLIK